MVEIVLARKFSAYLIVLLLSTAAFVVVSFDTQANQVSNDPYGYYWTDSNVPSPSVTFEWIDVTATGTNLGFYDADDSYEGPVPIGFNFEFYGINYSAVNVSSNGYVQFGDSSSYSWNNPIPYQYDVANNIVAAFWDDLVVYDTSYNYGAVYYDTIGVSPNQQMVIEYHEISRDYDSDLMTFEIILNETGEIWLQYMAMNGETGSSATVGIENADGTIASQYSYNEPAISDGLAVRFDRGLVGFGPDATARGDWGSFVDYDVSLMNCQAVTDSFNVTVDHSALGWAVEILDDSYSPLVGNSTGNLLPGESFDIVVRVTIPDPPSTQNETTVLIAASSTDPAVNDTVTLTTMADQAVFSPPFSDYGYDSDSDGDYDYLVVNVTVDAIVGGYLYLQGELYDAGAEYLAFDAISVPVPAGSSNLSLYFTGEDIHQEMANDPYEVVLWLYDADWYAIGFTWHTTSTYNYTDFDEPIAMFYPPHSDYALDNDANGVYDFLVVNASVQIFTPGQYTVMADVREGGTSDLISYAEVSLYLSAGVHEMQLQIPAWAVNESGLDGTCYVYLDLYQGDSAWLMDDEYETGSYIWSDFEGKPAAFLPPYDDYAVDTDLDGYDNYVVITIPIECYETGLYDIYIEVYEWVYLFDVVSDSLSLDEGTTTNFTIIYDAQKMREESITDNLDLDMFLLDNATQLECDSDSYSTSYYYYYNFDPVGVSFFDWDDYGRDTDSDGYYNEIVITIYMDPLSSGYFALEVSLYDNYYDFMELYEEVVYMQEGVQEAYEIVVDAYDIAINGVYGWFYLYASVYDETESVLYDTDSYYTSNYYQNDFDPVGAFFESAHNDAGRDDDGDGFFDYLVFEIRVNASSSGYYDLEVDIWDNWVYYDTLWLDLYIEADTVRIVQIEVDSYWIRESGVSGYWYLDMYLYDHYAMVEYDYESYTTGTYYDVSDFDPPDVQFDSPHNDYTVDIDGDSYFDYLMVEVELDCLRNGEYTVWAYLYDYYDSFIVALSSTEYMVVGDVNVEFAFEGWMIEYNGVSGYFTVELEVENENGLVMDYDTHLTSYYYYYWFEQPPAEFVPPHDDFAVDDDDDGLFEHMAMNVTVEIYGEGLYEIRGTIWDLYSDPVDAASSTEYLEEGVQEVQLWFSGWSIANAGEEMWYVELELFDGQGNLMDTDSHDIWGSYTRAEFDSTPPVIESGWAYEPPSIDGTVEEDEWFGAIAVDVVVADNMNGLAATIHMSNDDAHLFVLIDAVGDASMSDGDVAMIAFDTDNDDMPSDGHEDQFVLEATGAGVDTTHLTYDDTYSDWMTHCLPFDDSMTDHGGLEGAVGFGAGVTTASPHRVYEFCIPLTLLMLSPGDHVGFAGLPVAFDEDGFEYSTWPAYFWDMPPLVMYGDLILSEERPLTTIELEGEAGDNDWFLGDVEVTLTASGGTGGIDNTLYNLDSAGWQTYTAPFTVSGDDIHTVQFYSVDTAGNDEAIHTVEVMIDSVAPNATAELEGTMGLNGWLVSSARITFTGEDETSGVASFVFRLNDDDWSVSEEGLLRVSGDGSFTLEYYAMDLAGNDGPEQTLEFKIDMIAPVTSATVDGSTVTLSVEDVASGSAGTFYRIDGGEWQAYEGPFKVKGDGNYTVEFYSTDVAGNNETVKSILVEGAAGLNIFGVDWWVFLLIIAIVVLTVIGAVIGMRRRLRGRMGPQMMPPPPQHMAMVEGGLPGWPGGEQPTAPPPGEPPPPQPPETPPQ